MALFLYQDGFVAALKQMPHGSVAPIIELGVDAVELAHSLRKVSLRCFDNQVIVLCEAPRYVKLSFVFLFELAPLRSFLPILLHIIPML